MAGTRVMWNGWTWDGGAQRWYVQRGAHRVTLKRGLDDLPAEDSQLFALQMVEVPSQPAGPEREAALQQMYGGAIQGTEKLWGYGLHLLGYPLRRALVAAELLRLCASQDQRGPSPDGPVPQLALGLWEQLEHDGLMIQDITAYPRSDAMGEHSALRALDALSCLTTDWHNRFSAAELEALELIRKALWREVEVNPGAGH